jgi:UDP-N-acetylglucosamine--N-acetylmuramyl-(pentapeptide) pyrophosphoryl-undecaprenol N-acetylglucosamine transferase
MSAAEQAVLIMAGGTGGHIFPGLALADELRERGIGVRWLGAQGGMECTTVPERDIPLDVIHIGGVRGKGLRGWLVLPVRLLGAVREALACIRRHRPACAVSFGGYAAGPGGIAARLQRVPLIVHEQNRVPGMTNRFLARIATRVFQAFPGTFPASSSAETCGNPVRASVAALPSPGSRLDGRTGPRRLLVTGGSQGAACLNRLLPEALARLEPALQPVVRHQAGRRDADAVRLAYARAGIEAEVCEFIGDMAAAYGWADLAVCRAGALTISELATAGLGAVLVPFPHAVDDHQTRNAEFLLDAGGALLLPEAGLDAASLAAALGPLLADRAQMLAMARAAHRVAVRDAAARLARACGPFTRVAGQEAGE